MSIWKEIQKAINSDFTTEPLNDKTDRIETKVDTVDTVVDTINTNVGSNADSSSATGSVHAKLKDIKGAVDFQIPYVASLTQSSPTASTYYTIVNISGSGLLQRISYAAAGGDATTANIRVTIDGSAYTFSSIAVLVGVSSYGSNDVGGNIIDLIQKINFDTSLKVEIMNTNASVSTTAGFVEYTLN